MEGAEKKEVDKKAFFLLLVAVTLQGSCLVLNGMMRWEIMSCSVCMTTTNHLGR